MEDKMDFAERYKSGTDAERLVIPELEARGWNVEPGPRYFWSPGLNRFMTDWRDTHSSPCFLRWAPDFMVWHRGEPLRHSGRVPSTLYAVDVKTTEKTIGFGIERTALLTYQAYAETFNLPVVVVFVINGEMLASSVGKLSINTQDKFGAAADRTPYYVIDPTKLSTMERFFGEKPNGVKP